MQVMQVQIWLATFVFCILVSKLFIEFRCVGIEFDVTHCNVSACSYKWVFVLSFRCPLVRAFPVLLIGVYSVSHNSVMSPNPLGKLGKHDRAVHGDASPGLSHACPLAVSYHLTPCNGSPASGPVTPVLTRA